MSSNTDSDDNDSSDDVDEDWILNVFAQVDCFSFGMFVYELLLLRAPYDDTGSPGGTNINIKGHVLAGGRPKITSKVL